MKTIPCYECFMTVVDSDDNKKFHKTFDLAVKRLIRDSCDISAEPWGGLSRGKVTENNHFYLEYVSYVKDNTGQRHIINRKNKLSFVKDWGDGPASLTNIYGECKNDKRLLDRIYKGIEKRWTYGWRLVEKKEKKYEGA